MVLTVVSTMVELWPLGHSFYGNPFLIFFLYIEKCWKRYLFNECKAFKGMLECTCFKHAHNVQSHQLIPPLLTSKIPLQLMGKVLLSFEKTDYDVRLDHLLTFRSWSLWNHVVPTSSDIMEVMLASLSLAPGHSARCDVGTHRSLVWLKCDAFQPKRRLTNHCSFWPLPLETNPC